MTYIVEREGPGPQSLKLHNDICSYGSTIVLTVSTRNYPVHHRSLTLYTVQAFLYDWALAISAEVSSVQKTRLNLPIVAYYVSRYVRLSAGFSAALNPSTRICSLVYCLCEFLIKLALVGDTESIEILQFAAWWAAGAATSLLFFFRVRAVFTHCKTIRVMFILLWIVIVVSPTAILYTLFDNCELAAVCSLRVTDSPLKAKAVRRAIAVAAPDPSVSSVTALCSSTTP